jgi:threonine/homoserine/homoserine lactone efflux protein
MALSILITFILQGAALGLSAAASPGPLQTYLISETLRGGWRRGALVSLAPLASDPPIVLAILLLLNQLPAWLLRGINLAGGVYVWYLAWGLWRDWRAETGKGLPDLDANPGSFKKAVLMNVLSPGPYTFWSLLAGPILLEALQAHSLYGAGFVGGFYGVFIGGMLGLAAVFHQARRFGTAAIRALLLVSLLVLVVFGGILLLRGLFWG